MTRILLLAGTTEARELAARISVLPEISPIASLAGMTAGPQPYAIPVRRGGFGGADGLRTWLVRQRCVAVIDATHPYAATIQANARKVTSRLGLPYLRLLRPPWPLRPDWQVVPDAASAAGLLPAGARVLLTSGRKEIAPFAARRDVTFFLRTIEPVGGLPAHIRPILARPPFTREAEEAVLSVRQITHLVTKNAGGDGTGKLDAADALRLTTIVIDRPPPSDAETVATVEEAVAWLQRMVALAPPSGPADGPA